MNKRCIWWFASPFLVGAIAYLATSGFFIKFSSSYIALAPRIDYPATLDLGSHENGDQILKRFTRTNIGAGELLIDNIQTNCSCTGMEREQDGQFVHINELRLQAGESAEVVVRVSVRGVPFGTEMRNVIDFQTNDPKNPKGRIEAIVRHVTGGIHTNPNSVVFGTVSIGERFAT